MNRMPLLRRVRAPHAREPRLAADHVTRRVRAEDAPYRRGLSTLELVLSLPILLLVMALMINYGTVASWKVRGLSLARHEVWSHRAGRSSYPQKQYWSQYWPGFPEGLGVGGGGTGPVASLDDPRVDHPVMRGPMVENFTVDDRFDPTRGMREGSSTVARAFPLLKRLGRYTLRSATQLLDDRWDHETVGLWANRDRRIPLIYTLPRTAADMGLAMRYIRAVARIWYAPFQRDLWPMDKDDEFIYWGGRFWAEGRPGWGPWPWARDFYRDFAWLETFCNVDEDETQRRVERLVDRIQGKPGDATSPGMPSIVENMTRAFIDFFERRVIPELEDQLNAQPPPPPDVRGQLEKEIRDLKDKIDQLRQQFG